MYRDVAKDIANGVAHQKDISYEGLELMQKKYNAKKKRRYRSYRAALSKKTCKSVSSFFVFHF